MAQIDFMKNCTCNSYIFQLPLAFDESLSYLEQICAILKKLNETIEQVNKNTEVLDNIDVNFENIYKIVNDMIDQFHELEQEFDDFKLEVDEEIDAKYNQIYNQVILLMNDYQASFNLRLETEIGAVNHRIDEIELGDIEVYNPTTGLIENINKVLNDIYDSVRYDAITCSEFDGLELSATDFDAIEITAYNFDNNGKSILTNI